MDWKPDPGVPIRRRATLYLRRHWRCRSLDLVCAGELAVTRGRLSIRRESVRSVRSPIRGYHRRLLRYSWHDYLFDSQADEHIHWRHGFCWNWSRNQRTYCTRCHLRARSNGEARKVRGDFDLYDHPLLPVSSLGPAYRLLLDMALDWSSLRYLEHH